MAKKKKSVRQQDRPKVARRKTPIRQNRKVQPEQYDKIADQWARGKNISWLAERYEVNRKTMRAILDRHIFAPSRGTPRRSIDAELIRIDAMEKLAWERFESNAPAETREQIEEALQPTNGDKVAKKTIRNVMSIIRRPAGDITWLGIVQWCIEQRCRLLGHYAATKVDVEIDEYRVAGLTPDQLDAAMMKRLMTKIIERRAYEQLLREPKQITLEQGE